LPSDLASDGAVLTVTPASGNSGVDATMAVDAQCGGHRLSEQVKFHRGDAGWALVDVAMNP
jgi:hypothetical protein